MVRHTLKILQHLLQDFLSVSDHFTTLRSKGLTILMICKFQEKPSYRAFLKSCCRKSWNLRYNISFTSAIYNFWFWFLERYSQKCLSHFIKTGETSFYNTGALKALLLKSASMILIIENYFLLFSFFIIIIDTFDYLFYF